MAQQQSKVTAEILEEKIKEKLDPAKHESLDRIVVAGMKLMFGEKTHKLFQQQMEEDATMSENMTVGITKLMMLMFKQSNESMPVDLIVPAAAILLAKAYEFLVKAGEDVTEDDYAEAMKAIPKLIMKQFGATDEHFAQAEKQGQQPAPQPQAGGMLQGA